MKSKLGQNFAECEKGNCPRCNNCVSRSVTIEENKSLIRWKCYFCDFILESELNKEVCQSGLLSSS
jgi:transcription elongation factor Elf1